MKKYFLWPLVAAFYCFVVYVFYLILPPAISVEVVLAPAKYVYVEENPITGSRIARLVWLQDYDQVRIDLENFYRKCATTQNSTARVLAKSGQNETSHFVIQDIAAEVSRKHIDCAIDMLHKKEDVIWGLLNTERRLIPPASLEKEKFTLIEVKDLSERSRSKAVIRAVVLGVVLFVLAYSIRVAFLRVRKSRKADIST